MQLLSPHLQIGNLRLENFRAKKKVVALPPDGSFPQQIGCRAGRPHNKATPATGSFGEFKLLYKNINLNAPCGVIAGS
jgi:hypothetical protein